MDNQEVYVVNNPVSYDTDNPFDGVKQSLVMISDKVNITNNTAFDVNMHNVLTGAQFNLNFSNVPEGTTLEKIEVHGEGETIFDSGATFYLASEDPFAVELWSGESFLIIETTNKPAIENDKTITLRRMIIPTTLKAGGDVKIKVYTNKGDKEFTYPISNDKALECGKYYSFTQDCDMSNLHLMNWIDSASEPFTSGDGTSAESAYQISTPEQLAYLAKTVNDGEKYENKYFKLTADINLAGKEWTAIGNEDNNKRCFSGIFDGDGHTIKGLYINQPTKNQQALFGYAIGCEIKNLKVEESVISGNALTAGIVGYTWKCKITNCSFSGSVTGMMFVGGICGNTNYSTISNCSNTATVKGLVKNDIAKVGGIFGGCSDGTIINCHNAGSVSGWSQVGGVGAYVNYSSKILNCSNTGAVQAKKTVSGICGEMWPECSIINCYNTGELKGEMIVGGICGQTLSSTIVNCYNTGKLNGNEKVGGICGYLPNDNEVKISNCYYLESSAYNGVGYGTPDGTPTEKSADDFAAFASTLNANAATYNQANSKAPQACAWKDSETAGTNGIKNPVHLFNESPEAN